MDQHHIYFQVTTEWTTTQRTGPSWPRSSPRPTRPSMYSTAPSCWTTPSTWPGMDDWWVNTVPKSTRQGLAYFYRKSKTISKGWSILEVVYVCTHTYPIYLLETSLTNLLICKRRKDYFSNRIFVKINFKKILKFPTAFRHSPFLKASIGWRSGIFKI